MRSAWIAMLGLVLVGGCTSGDDGGPSPNGAAPDAGATEACVPRPQQPEPPDSCPPDVEYCVYSSRLWQAWCKDGHVLLDEVTPVEFCYCGTEHVACQRSTAGDPVVRTECPSGCRNDEVVTLEWYDQIEASSLSSYLCAMPDAGPPDGGP